LNILVLYSNLATALRLTRIIIFIIPRMLLRVRQIYKNYAICTTDKIHNTQTEDRHSTVTTRKRSTEYSGY